MTLGVPARPVCIVASQHGRMPVGAVCCSCGYQRLTPAEPRPVLHGDITLDGWRKRFASFAKPRS